MLSANPEVLGKSQRYLRKEINALHLLQHTLLHNKGCEYLYLCLSLPLSFPTWTGLNTWWKQLSTHKEWGFGAYMSQPDPGPGVCSPSYMGLHIEKSLTPGLMICCQHLEILSNSIFGLVLQVKADGALENVCEQRIIIQCAYSPPLFLSSSFP